MKTAVLRKIENTWEPEMMAPEEALALLDNKGIRYEMCDTPVPYSENKVSCGKPLDIGSIPQGADLISRQIETGTEL